jgi:hypothetical protein
VSGGLTVVALNSWHHWGVHVIIPVVLFETPVQPCALAGLALVNDKNPTTRRNQLRKTKPEFLQRIIAIARSSRVGTTCASLQHTRIPL